MQTFSLHREYEPAGDQPRAIQALSEGLAQGRTHQTLLGATGTGKTFTCANVIADYSAPTLVIAHNKTLAAQLAAEYRAFFPDHAVHYFVSYYDYYQPEAYVPTSDTYIEKEAQINEEIDRLRHAATQALLTRRDVIVVASVSCIYGLGSPAEYEKVHIKLAIGGRTTRAELIRRLIGIYFERTNADLHPGTFRAVGNRVEIMPGSEQAIYRIDFDGGVISAITEIDPVTRSVIREHDTTFIFPAKHFVTPEDERERAMADIKAELSEQLATFERQGKVLEAERLKRRTKYDLAMIREIGYCAGIENYSRHFDGRSAGEAPHTLLSYFPHTPDGSADFLTIIDESHVTIPQIAGMYAGDRARKDTLVEHGFRLPSAIDNRPLTFDEFEERVGPRIYTSATPGKYEYEHSVEPDGIVVDQIIRPTGLVDPAVEVRPVVERGDFPGQVRDFIDEAQKVIAAGNRALATTLTKRMAEDLTGYLTERGMRAAYIHSDVHTIERIEIITHFRRGEFDVLVGVNLLREGLDMPEVAFIGILDADKEGFLRSETSLIQTIGRAARNVDGHVILYADEVTGSMQRAMDETKRRRDTQLAYNAQHGITPQTIRKAITDIAASMREEREKVAQRSLAMELADKKPSELMKEKREAMERAVQELDFETAAILRDEIRTLEERIAAGGASATA